MQIEAWLVSLGLPQYVQVFAENAIDQETLRTLTDADLKQLANHVAALGHRKKLLGAIALLCGSGIPSAVREELAHRLPLVLAGPLDAYRNEPHPVMRLWHICDFVELSLRLATFASLGAHGPNPPEELRKALAANHLERPTMGNWAGLAMAAGRHLPKGMLPFLPNLLGIIMDLLGPKDASPETGLLTLRNRLAHGGAITKQMAGSLLSAWGDRFGAACDGPRTVAGALALVARDHDGAGRRFRGPDSAGATLPADEAPTFLQPGALGLVGADTAISLWPLGDCSTTDDGTLAQVYSRRGEVRLEYTPLERNLGHGLLRAPRRQRLPRVGAALPHRGAGIE